ncbi:MAG: beta-galactosidase [Armatimonadota bacterium]
MKVIIAVFLLTLIFLLSSFLFAQNELPRVSYTPLSDEAKRTNVIEKYSDVKKTTGNINLGNYKLEYSIPESIEAYDTVPIEYKLIQSDDKRRVAVQAIAFEDPEKVNDDTLYDLAIPGNMNVKLEYLGSIGADFTKDKYIPLTSDPKTPISPFPPYKLREFETSSSIKPAEAVWFKFRLTNIGDTILDPEGFGAAFFEPRIVKFNDDGKIEFTANTINSYERFKTYLYPGDSYEFWVNFHIGAFHPQGYTTGLLEGKYQLELRFVYRYHRTYDWWINVWTGKLYSKLIVPITVSNEAKTTPIKPKYIIDDDLEKMPGIYDRFEEFMTSFNIYQSAEKSKTIEDILYLQVAPWTKHVTLKLIATDPKEIAIARIPVNISLDSLLINYNPNNVMVVDNNGREEPVIIVQAMPGMRTGIQLGPYPEKHMKDEINEMKELGVNLIANTAGGWWIGELKNPNAFNLLAAQYKYFYDVLIREAGIKAIGWSVYPPTGKNWFDAVIPLIGQLDKYSKTEDSYHPWLPYSIDISDPQVPYVINAWVKYQYERWGDYWFKTKDGRVPISIEDSWGWMRDDINIRYQLGPLSIQKFRDWVKDKYSKIENANSAWNASFISFEEIDPQEAYPNNNPENKETKNSVFYDWSVAMEDWDTFRTQLRMKVYDEALKLIREYIPTASFELRTEGANLVIPGDPKSENMHLRHVYFSQRRNAFIYDYVKNHDAVQFYSDYTTLPYSTTVWRDAMKTMVESGIIPTFLPQFDHMRDILLNPYYGLEYKTHYNLDQPSKGMMVHSLLAAYPWWKATYEEGGAPGIIWSDFLCDGFATETQKKELKLLREHFNKMIDEQEIKKGQ